MLFCPASRERAVAKARESGADMVILDLEDAVAEDDKASARDAAVEAVAQDWPMPVGIRANGIGHGCHAVDVAAITASMADFLVLPLVNEADSLASIAAKSDIPVAAMVETARGVVNVGAIAEVAAMLIVGTNDLAADLRLPAGRGRGSMDYALQRVVLAARARGIAAYDGVCNVIDAPEQIAHEASEAHRLGFDGKTLIHPNHIAPVRDAFAPSEADVERARRVVALADQPGGAINFEGEMVEAMHIASAKRLLERAGVGESG
ncbi:HpcH/HpaI aldolase/citrate lyase family protein [Sphingomicrobium arenosum]|uniref:HpcH/HpaI aldolase/citrate lyase family protein n=1 Tax=Sphingomicrobium arenosum TaxID=2233861 RepID=UPI0022405EA2|nr:CoA ester lyase [Sphingomicrobium arenosum]